MPAKLLTRIDKLDAMSRRDRASLALGLLAFAVGVEMLLVEPMQLKRQRIEQSATAESESKREAQAAAASERTARQQALQQRSEQLEIGLVAAGMKNGMKAEHQRETLSAFLARSLRQQGVTLVSIQGLAVEAVNTPTLASDGSATTAVALTSETTASSPGANTAIPLFRHRTELTLEGSVAHLTATIDWLERGMAPLRVERVRMASHNADKNTAAGIGTVVHATVVLTVINQERAWMVL